MRVALIDPSLFTWPYDSELALALSNAGNDVTVYGKALDETSNGAASGLLRNHFYRALDFAWIRRLPRPVFLGLKGANHFVSMLKLLRTLQLESPDIIHFQWAPLPMIDRWFIASLRRIAPTILTVHDSAPFNNNPRSRVQRWGATGILSRFDHLIVHTRAAARRVESYGVDTRRVSVIPHGVLGGNCGTPARRARRTDDREDVVRILLFGKIKPYKGVDVLLKAIALLSPEIMRRCKLWVVGSPYMDMAPLISFAESAGIGDNVEFELRFVDDLEISGILSRADIMVMPYREIDASGVLMMALAAGLPIVASRIGLFAELLQEGEHGRLVPVDDPQALASALSELIADSVLRAEMGMRVLALSRSIPDWNEIANKTTRLYGEIIVSRRALIPAGADR